MLQAWFWLKTHRKTRLALIAAVVCTISYFVNMTNAMAFDMDSGSYQTYFLPIGDVKDTAGVPIASYYELPLDYGRLSYPRRLIRGVLLGLAWNFYTFVVFGIIAFLNFILSFVWLDWILSPFTLLANSIDGVLGQMGLIGLGLSITALVVAITAYKVGFGAALAELVIAAFVAALVGTSVGNPTSYFSGDNSVVKQSSEFGSQLGNATVNSLNGGDVSNTTGDSSTNPISTQLVDMTVRAPAQMISFGKQLDEKCSKQWDEAYKDGADAEKVRKKINGCDKDAKNANETDSYQAMGFYLLNMTGVVGLFFLIVVFGFFIVKDVVLALLGCVNVVIKGYLAVFPGPGRYAFFNALAQVAVNVIMVALYVWALSAYLWVIGKITESIGAVPLMLGSAFLGILIIIMTITFIMMKARGKKAGEALARYLSKLGLTSKPSARAGQPSRLKSAAREVIRTGPNALRAGKTLGKFLGAGATTGGVAAGALAAKKAATAMNKRRKAAKDNSARRAAAAQEDITTPPKPGRSSTRPGAIGGVEPRPALETVGADRRGDLMERPAPNPPAPTDAPGGGPEAPTKEAPSTGPGQYGRINNVVRHTDGSSTVLEGEIHEGPLPKHVKAAQAWGGGTPNITNSKAPQRKRTLYRQLPSTFGTGGAR